MKRGMRHGLIIAVASLLLAGSATIVEAKGGGGGGRGGGGISRPGPRPGPRPRPRPHFPRRYFLWRSYGFYGPYSMYPQFREADSDEMNRHKENVQTNVSPKNTEIYAGGLLYSKKGKTRFNLPNGEWKLEFRAPGYRPQTLDLKVEEGVKYLIERKLEKETQPAQMESENKRDGDRSSLSEEKRRKRD